jgi:hypothetical protein
MPNKTCFVVMGFGTKTDYARAKTFNLDKTYNVIIKPAARAAGFECLRADEIVHSGNINVPMYEQLLKADVVVADVSTYNSNAFYELGVRHALRPYSTIIISEDGLTFPFDVGLTAVWKYHHLGEGIDYDEAERMKQELSKAMKILGEKEVDDSPVYTFIRGLMPPMLTVADAMAASVTLRSSLWSRSTSFLGRQTILPTTFSWSRQNRPFKKTTSLWPRLCSPICMCTCRTMWTLFIS